MKIITIWLISSAILVLAISSAQAVSTFGASATGSDLEPVGAFLSDGGPGSSSASVNFLTFRADASFSGLPNTYLPILRAESNGIGATFDDDRTQVEAEAYQVFSSSITQTIVLDITLDSIVTNSPGGTSGVLSDIFVIGGPRFAVSKTSCSPGQFTFGGVYLCGSSIAQSSAKPLNWSNLFNDGSSPLLTDTLTFDVLAGESFAIFASLDAGSFMGTADAFNTLSMGFQNDEFIDVATVPGVIPVPAAVWLFGTAMMGLLGFNWQSKKAEL